MSKLAIGTVQFGLDYGIQNRKKVERSEIIKILQVAKKNNINTLDTAAGYGESERVLGSVISEADMEFRIVSKISQAVSGQIKQQLLESLKRLNAVNLYACMFHDFKMLKKNILCFKELQACSEDGLVEKVGVSLYYPEEWEFLQKKRITPDIIQIPYNLFDRRFEKLLPEIKRAGVEIHVRSVFLQGLLCIPPASLDQYFLPALPTLQKMKELASIEKASVPELAFRFVSENKYIDYIVVGMTTEAELIDNIRLIKCPNLSVDLKLKLDEMNIDDEKIILPVNWPNNRER